MITTSYEKGSGKFKIACCKHVSLSKVKGCQSSLQRADLYSIQLCFFVVVAYKNVFREYVFFIFFIFATSVEEYTWHEHNHTNCLCVTQRTSSSKLSSKTGKITAGHRSCYCEKVWKGLKNRIILWTKYAVLSLVVRHL